MPELLEDRSLSPAQRALICENAAAELLALDEPSERVVRQAQAYATLGQSFRLHEIVEELDQLPAGAYERISA